MTIPEPGIEHRRDDGELVGWIRPEGDRWTAVDILGRVVATSVGWLEAEEALEERGLAFLADPWMLDDGPGRPLRVRIVAVTPARIRVKLEDFGDAGAPQQLLELPWPIPGRLRAERPGDPDPYTL